MKLFNWVKRRFQQFFSHIVATFKLLLFMVIMISSTTTDIRAPIIQSSKVLRDSRNTSYILSLTYHSASKLAIPSWYKGDVCIVNSTRFLQTDTSKSITISIYNTTLNIIGYVTNLTISSKQKGKYSVHLQNKHGETTRDFFVDRVSDRHSFDLRTLLVLITATGIVLFVITFMTIYVRVRFLRNMVIIIGPLNHLPSIPVYHSAPEDRENVHKYEDTDIVPQYLQVIDSVEQVTGSITNYEESGSQVRTPHINTDLDYEEIN